MLAPKQIWQIMRVLKWACWIGTVVYYLECYIHRSAHQNSFGQLYHSTEFWIFMLPLGATFFGLMEMASREKAGIPRPPFLRNWSGEIPQSSDRSGTAPVIPR